MDTNKLKAIIIVIFALFAAVYLGISAATAQEETIVWVVGGLTFFTCILLGRKIWLLLPFLGALAIQFRLPGQPDTQLLGQLLVLGFSTLLFLMRKLPWRLAFTEMEFWVMILTLFVVQVYLRNPTGLNIFGGATVGGKPYALFVVSLATAILLSGLRPPVRELKWILPLSILGGMGNLGIHLLGKVVPVVSYYCSGDYVDTRQANYENMNVMVDEKAATRVGFLSGLGNNLSLWIATFISPLKACFRPLWALLILITVISSLLGGFRNGVAAVGMTFLLGVAYRSGVSGLLFSLFGGAGAVVVLAILNLVHPLPPNVQRSLSFLPGTWEQRYEDDAEGSNEWRFEIWKEALLTDRWIQNKWLGDGLGFSAVELAAQINSRQDARIGASGFEGHREAIMANGDYHSGPVSTIRTIGYVGLFFFLIGQIRLAVHAHRQIMRCQGSEWWPLALFIGIPLIWGPAFFVFIFGSFQGGVSAFLMGAGMIRLLENNLPLPVYQPRGRRDYRPLALNRAMQQAPSPAAGR